ncbi:hypothetical protein L1987_49513 [Smallanthus sonchifolius]|uniref:Uncharacterized protein n=1 Tax=Smallanthus sonchifolius TaxID=185202 RepID=A0ACB9FVY2_9ASTR|nr:hypothetical protein L1987_49513 [Smallanthus sonchifolius]
MPDDHNSFLLDKKLNLPQIHNSFELFLCIRPNLTDMEPTSIVNQTKAFKCNSACNMQFSETRTLTTFLSKERNGGVLIEKGREILEESTRRHNMEELSTRYKINRRSPGGPDPRHH